MTDSSPYKPNDFPLCSDRLPDYHPFRDYFDRLPRIASFIGTSNSRELLSDPSGSRRFICVLVEHPIDSTGIDHAQIYAQLKAELENGERYWFSHGEENALRLHNAALYRICPAGEVLRRYYRAAQPGEKVRPLSLPEIFARLRRLEPGAMAGVTLPKLLVVDLTARKPFGEHILRARRTGTRRVRGSAP